MKAPKRQSKKVDPNAKVVSCRLEPYRKSTRYKVTMSDGSVRWLQRTTHILKNLAKPGLTRWAAMQTANYYEKKRFNGETPNFWEAVAEADRVRDISRDFGNVVHKAIEAYLRDGIRWDPSKMSLEEAYALDSWLAWWEAMGHHASKVEFIVYSLTSGYGGSIDLVVKDGDGWIIYDWKTSESLQDEYAWQMAAYALAMHEMGLGEVHEAVIIKLPKRLGEPIAVNTVWDRERTARRQQLMAGWMAFLIACASLPELTESQEQEPIPEIGRAHV